MSRKIRTQKGMTLLEILIGMGTFAAGMSALVGLHSEVARRNILARETANALMLAQNAMESQKVMDNNIFKDNGPLDGKIGPLDAKGRLAASGLYTITWDIIPDTPVAGLKQVRVKASWETRSHRTREIILDTVVAQAAGR